jgi:hypothetical protein
VPSIKFLLFGFAVLIGWWLLVHALDELNKTGRVSIKEKFRELGGKVHSTVGLIAIVILLILLLRLVFQAIRWG